MCTRLETCLRYGSCHIRLMVLFRFSWLPLSTSEGLCSDPPAPDVVWENSWSPSKGVFGDSSCLACFG